VLQNLKELLG